MKKTVTAARQRKGEQAVWQGRFWEQQIRDEADYARHIEYIHYNPVKHGLTLVPSGWPYSSFHRFARQRIYPATWGCGEKIVFPENIGME